MRILEVAPRGLGGEAFALLVVVFVASVLALVAISRRRSRRSRFPAMATIAALGRVGGPGGPMTADEGVRVIPTGRRDDADAVARTDTGAGADVPADVES